MSILRLIAARLLCAVGEPYRYAETVLTTICAGEEFSAKGKVVLDEGWKSIERRVLGDLLSKKKEPAALPDVQKQSRCSIPSVRAAATKFIRETFDSYVHFFTEKSERRQITEHYRLTELPDGYAEEIVVKNDSCCISFYQNEEGDRIIFAQSVTEDFAIDVDNENGKHSQIDLSGTDVSIYESAGVMVAVWLHNQYAFNLTVYGDYGIDLMIKLIDSVQRQ